jgi:hypothetical protein
MTLTFRNLTITPDAPVPEWPTEAVQTALERGDLADWHRIAAEIGADPWGRTARQVEEVLSHSRPYGVAEAMETILSRARERAEASERAAVAAVHLCLWQGNALGHAHAPDPPGSRPAIVR